jgi:hypothetical protein
MSDRRFDREDPLGPARGLLIGLLLSAALWLLAFGGLWIAVRGLTA